MFGFSAERPLLSWLLRRLGPPPPPPRRHFSKSLDCDAQRPAVSRRRGEKNASGESNVTGVHEAVAGDADGSRGAGSNRRSVS